MLRQTFLIIAVLLSVSQQTYAQSERWFEVEVYLFERNDGQSQEHAPEQVNFKNPKKMVDLISPLFSTNITGASLGLDGCSAHDWVTKADECNQQLSSSTQMNYPPLIPWRIAALSAQYGVPGGSPVLLASDQNHFKDIIAKLSRERGNKSLLHITWQQAMQPRHRAKPIRLFSGKDYSSRFNLNGQSILSQTPQSVEPQFDFLEGNFDAVEHQPVWKIDGTINIYLDHFLYVETALNLREEGTKTLGVMQDDTHYNSSDIKISSPFLYSFPMKQNRRVRSNEIHYFDHPRMGMILQIRKMQQPISR
ncbi:MAG: peptidoglycan binding protein CsiV [Shewanella sp.]